jgi:Peptidase_C39 like family
MTGIARTKVTRVGRIAGFAAALGLAASASLVGFAGPAYAAPGPPAPHANAGGMHGDPAAAAPFWRYQEQNYDCGEMAVADVVGQITGHQPDEDQVTAAAENVPSVNHPGPIYSPANRTSNTDLPVLLTHYGIRSAATTHTNIDSLMQDLDQGRKVIVGVNDKTIWNQSGDRSVENHFVVVTGIDTGAGVVHLNDTGSRVGRDEQISISTFEQAWGTSSNFAVVTK